MTRFVLSEAARLDRREITTYTVDRFGLQQARRLRDQLQATLHSLAEPQLIGRANAALDPPGHTFRYFVVMKIIIVYELRDGGIRVARLLHGARNRADELDRQTGEGD